MEPGAQINGRVIMSRNNEEVELQAEISAKPLSDKDLASS